jgi:hypothetical protein
METFVRFFSKEEVDTLSAFVSPGNICYCIILAYTGDSTIVLNAFATPSDDSWTIHFGASNHMTCIS